MSKPDGAAAVSKVVGGRKPGTPKTGGRKKGTPNKTTTAAKEAIALAAEELGGTRRLVDWAKEDPLNERMFWGTIYPKLLPLQVGGVPGEPIETITRIELAAMSGHSPD
ncbi:hypothetical protein [Achromobacter ruhlandii]|uniref:hypothetical protein n=1 Tax=Achromobacter ruhlandii TaxID=72557 RepID=UPI0015830D14|nr:hypothetical protein [Achromobacter ruhlandii]